MKKLIGVILLFASINVSAVGIDESDPITNNGNAYIVSNVVGAGAGFRSIGQLWNPVGSNKIVYVDRIIVSHGYCDGPSGVDLRFGSNPFGAVFVNGRNKNLSISTPSTTQLRSAHYVAPLQDFTLYEIFEGGCYRNATIPMIPPVRIPPGFGIYLSTGNDNANLPVTYEFREYPIQ